MLLFWKAKPLNTHTHTKTSTHTLTNAEQTSVRFHIHALWQSVNMCARHSIRNVSLFMSCMQNTPTRTHAHTQTQLGVEQEKENNFFSLTFAAALLDIRKSSILFVCLFVCLSLTSSRSQSTSRFSADCWSEDSSTTVCQIAFKTLPLWPIKIKPLRLYIRPLLRETPLRRNVLWNLPQFITILFNTRTNHLNKINNVFF